MQNLKADAQGFLMGSGQVKPTDEDRLLQGIAADVRAMREMMQGKAQGKGRQRQAERESVAVPSRTGRGAGATTASPTRAALRVVQTLGVAKPVSARRGNSEAREVAETIARSLRRPGPKADGKPAVATPVRVRDERGRYVAAKPGTVKPEAADPSQRNVKGQFVAGAEDTKTKKKKADEETEEKKDKKVEESLLRRTVNALGDKIAGLSGRATDGAGEVDPSLKAANEVAELAGGAVSGVKAIGGAAFSIAKPMARGMRGMFGARPSDAPTPWFRRFFGEMRLFRRESSVFNKAEIRLLKDIEAKPEDKGRGGIGGMLMMLLGPLIAAIGAAFTAGFGMLSKLPGLGLLAKMMLGGLPTMAGQAAKGAGGLLKRIPLLGAALAAIGAGSDVYDSETDSSLTRAEKDQKTGKAIGAGGGTIAGMLSGGAAGAAMGALAGPIGAAIGGVVGAVAGGFFGEKAGAVLGETVGGWVTELRRADIPSMVGRAWTDTGEWIKTKWDGALSVFTGVWDKAKGVFDDFALGVTALLGKLGIDLPGMKQKAADLAAAAAQKAKAAGGAVAGAAGAAVDLGKEKAGQVGEALKNSTMGRGAAAVSGKLADGWKAAKGYLVGASDAAGVDPGIVAKIAAFESGFNADAAPIRKDGSRMSSAHGYGQFLDGTWTDMLNKHGAKYGVAGAGTLTKTDADKLRGDKSLQAAMLAEFTKKNIAKGRALGGEDDDANAYAYHNLGAGDAKKLLSGMQANPAISVRDALMQGADKAKDPNKERARVEAVIAGNKSLYGDGNITATAAYGRMGDVMRRGEAFAKDARASSNATPNVTAGVPATATVNTSLPPIKAPATMPFPAAPALDELALSRTQQEPATMFTDKKPTVVVSAPPPLAGRDLANRPMAHIVTGGHARA